MLPRRLRLWPVVSPPTMRALPCRARWCCGARHGLRWTCPAWSCGCRCGPPRKGRGRGRRCAPNRSGTLKVWSSGCPNMRNSGFDIMLTFWASMRSTSTTWMGLTRISGSCRSCGAGESFSTRIQLLRSPRFERSDCHGMLNACIIQIYCTDRTEQCHVMITVHIRTNRHIWCLAQGF